MIVTYEQVLEWIEQYEVGADVVMEAVMGLSEEQLTKRPNPEKWSIREIVAHLTDTEIVMVHRMRTVMAEGKGILTVFSQDEWIDELAAAKMPVSVAIDTLRALRAYHAATLRQLPEKDLVTLMERTGTHEADGDLSAFHLLQKAVTHLHHHTRQIAALRKNL